MAISADIPITFRVSPEMSALLATRAAELGFRSGATYARWLVEQGVGIKALPETRGERSTDAISPERRKAIAELSRVGGNLNQLVRHLNSGAHADERLRARTEEVIASIAAIIRETAKGL